MNPDWTGTTKAFVTLMSSTAAVGRAFTAFATSAAPTYISPRFKYGDVVRWKGGMPATRYMVIRGASSDGWLDLLPLGDDELTEVENLWSGSFEVIE